jgi:hypothetical protein
MRVLSIDPGTRTLILKFETPRPPSDPKYPQPPPRCTAEDVAEGLHNMLTSGEGLRLDEDTSGWLTRLVDAIKVIAENDR